MGKSHTGANMDRWILEEVMVFAGLMATLGCITKIILSAMNRRKPILKEGASATLDDMAQRLARIEQAVDATSVEVERISEAQRFTTKLLVERGHQVGAGDNPRGRIVTPH
jgi:hypothetical protein